MSAVIAIYYVLFISQFSRADVHLLHPCMLVHLGSKRPRRDRATDVSENRPIDFNTNPNTNTDTNPERNTNTDRNTNTNTNTNTNRNTNTDSNPDTDSHTGPNPNTNAYTFNITAQRRI